MRKSKKTDLITPFLGAEASVEGTIEFQGTIRLDGKVNGKIISKNGTVIIGETAAVEADIMVDSAVIMGKVKGVVQAGKKIEVYPPGSVDGDIQSPVISIDAGVKFNGNCSMHDGKKISDNKSGWLRDREANNEIKIKNFPKKPLTIGTTK